MTDTSGDGQAKDGGDQKPLGGQDGEKSGDHKAGEETTGPDHELRPQPKGGDTDKQDDR